MARVLRSAICGLGRIGRHHAKWYHQLGCELVGFAVRRPESLAQGRTDLQSIAGRDVPGYLDWGELLESQRPDLVSVCTPAEAHGAAVRAALERGVAVLCEKPICWSAEPAAALPEARELVLLAEQRGLPLAVNLQYAYAAGLYRELCPATGPPTRCDVVLESRGKGTLREPDEIWMELGPHALSLAFGLVAGGQPQRSTLRVSTAPQRVTVEFGMASPTGAVEVAIACGQRPEGELVRRFGLNGALVDLSGRNNARGEYATYLSAAGREVEYPDLMKTSIERFVAWVAGGPAAATDGAVAVSNLSVQLEVAATLAGRREGRSNG